MDPDLYPVGVLHLDELGTIMTANRVAASLVGVAAADLVGRNILEFNAEDADRALAMLSFGTDLAEPMGPVAVRYRHADGSVRHGDLWAENHLADPEVRALVVILVPEAAMAVIADAQSSVAEGASVDSTLELLAASLRSHPFTPASGCWLISDEHGRRLVGAGDLPEAVRVALATPGMWWSSLHHRELVDVDVGAETDDHHQLLLAAGVRRWWFLPVPKGITGTVDAGVIVVRRIEGPISPNQSEHLNRIVTTAGLAFERSAMQARLSHAAFHDALTGVGNRERFFERAAPGLRAGSALLYVDLDEFKPVNDRHGHSTGDLVLVTVADRLRKAVRPTDRITRMGGDEFVVECAGLPDDAEAIRIAERIIEAVARPIVIDGVEIRVGASVGIAHSSTDVSVDALLERSDGALYAAKAAGRGRWHVAAPPDVVNAGADPAR